MIAPVTALGGRNLLDLADLRRFEVRHMPGLAHSIKAGSRHERPFCARMALIAVNFGAGR